MIYASLMLEMFPSKGLEFFKYMHTVRMAASRGYSLGLVNYDEQHSLRIANRDEASEEQDPLNKELESDGIGGNDTYHKLFWATDPWAVI
jgi:hypothetical protein